MFLETQTNATFHKRTNLALQRKILKLNVLIKNQEKLIDDLTKSSLTWKKKATNDYDLICQNKEKLKFLTGIPSAEVFHVYFTVN